MNQKTTHSSKSLYIQIVTQLIPTYGEDESRQLAKMLFEEYGILFDKIMMDEKISLDAGLQTFLNEKVALLNNHVPIQYALGKAHFFGREFSVNSSVLIPRQETEELVNEIINENKKPNLDILDIGSGSGCIGITLALELKDAKVTAMDIDPAALDVTSINAQRHGVQIQCVLNDILERNHLPAMYDIIVSNPPYVTEKEMRLMQHNVLDHEPHNALFVPDEDPLLFYKQILALAKVHLKSKGKLYFEINEHYGLEMIRLCEKKECTSIRLVQDLNGKDRMIKAMFD